MPELVAGSVSAAGAAMNANLRAANSDLQALSSQAAGLSAYDRSMAFADTASRLGGTLKSANQLQAEADKLFGATKGYQAVAGNPVGQRMLSGSRAVVGAVTPVTDLAGSVSNLAKAQELAARDFANLSRVLSDPNATFGQRMIASAKATQSAAAFVQRQQTLLGSLDAADRAYLERGGAYARLTKPVRPGMQYLGKMNGSVVSPIVKTATVLGSTAGVALGIITLPGLVRGTVDAGKKLATVIDDPNATEDQKLGAIADTARGGAGVVIATNGIRAGVQTLVGVAAESRFLGPTVARMAANPAVGTAGKLIGGLFRVLLPFADAGLLVADSIKLKQTWKNPNASGMDKAKAVLAVGLGVLKIATYFLPQTMFLRVAYMVASFGQLGIAAVDLSKALVPTLKKAGAAVALAVTNPREALNQAGAAVSKGVAAIGAGIKGAFARIAQFFSDPGAAVQQGQMWAANAKAGFSDTVATAWDVTKKSASLLKKKLDETVARVRGEATPAPIPEPMPAPVSAPVPAPAAPPAAAAFPAYTPIGASLPATEAA